MRILIALTALLAATGTAHAQDTTWSDGEIEYTTGITCVFPQVQQWTAAYTSQQVPAGGAPHAGDVFYVRATFGSVGQICTGGGEALPEFILPAGAERADGEPYWTVSHGGNEQRGRNEVVLSQGAFGGIVAAGRRDDGSLGSWPYANTSGFISVHIPVRARRRLNGIGTQAPNCPVREQSAAPCPDDQTGDWLQVYTQVADGGAPRQLIPAVGLFAREPRAPKLSAGKRPKARRFTVEARTAPGFVVQASVGKRSFRRVTADQRGVAKLRLRGRRGRVKLRVRAFADDGSASAAARRTLRLR
jgi:hypothetical protein